MFYKIYYNCYSCRYECWMFSLKGIYMYVYMEFVSGYIIIIFKEKKDKKKIKKMK